MYANALPGTVRSDTSFAWSKPTTGASVAEQTKAVRDRYREQSERLAGLQIKHFFGLQPAALPEHFP